MTTKGDTTQYREDMNDGIKYHVSNVTDNLRVRVVLQNTEEQFMRKSNILASNVANNILVRKI